MKFNSLTAALVTAAAFAAQAQDLGVKAPPQTAPIAIINATLHPVSGPEIQRGYILYDKGVIRAIGEGSPPAAAGTKVIDAGGRHVYPGLISPYTQLGLTEIQAVPSSIDTSETGRVTPEVVAVSAVNPDSTLIPVTRSNGVLSAAVFPSGGLISGQPSVIRLDGWTTEELTVRRSIGQAMNWPNTRTFTAWWMTQSEEDQSQNIRRDLDNLQRVFETARAYADARAADPASPADLRWEAMRPLFSAPGAKGEPPRLYVRANTTDQITGAVALAEQTGVKIVIIGGREAPACAGLLRKHDIPVIVMGTHNLPRRDDEAYDEPYTLPARLNGSGIRFAISHNDDTAHERNLPYQAAMAAAYGLDHDTALKSVTLWSAQISGVGDVLGSLEVGKAATLLVTDGSPLEITTKIMSAYIDGREIDLSNKHTKLADKYRERYRQQRPESASVRESGGGAGDGGGGATEPGRR